MFRRLAHCFGFATALSTDLVDNHRPRMDSHSYVDPQPMVTFEANVQIPNRLNDPQSRSDRSLCGVLGSFRIAKKDQDPVAKVLPNIPSAALNNFRAVPRGNFE